MAPPKLATLFDKSGSSSDEDNNREKKHYVGGERSGLNVVDPDTPDEGEGSESDASDDDSETWRQTYEHIARMQADYQASQLPKQFPGQGESLSTPKESPDRTNDPEQSTDLQEVPWNVSDPAGHIQLVFPNGTRERVPFSSTHTLQDLHQYAANRLNLPGIDQLEILQSHPKKVLTPSGDLAPFFSESLRIVLK